jgi:hypothetical protein
MGKVTYTDKSGKVEEKTFKTEDEGKKIRDDLQKQGIKGKFEW